MDTRAITREEIGAFEGVFRRTIGFGPPSEAELERDAASWDFGRTLATFDGGEIVGTTHSHRFELSLPGGGLVDACGVTAVATAPTHRRRGVASGLLRRQLHEAKDRGEPLAILIASEASIYRRFGYGTAILVTDVEMDPFEARGVSSQLGSGGVVRQIDEAAADELFPRVHDRMLAERPGFLRRPTSWWESITANRKAGQETHLVYESPSGEIEGYVRYQIKADWDAGAIPKHKLSVHELVALTDGANAELWRFLLSVDLVRKIDARHRPSDDPLRWMLGNPRAVRTQTVRDYLWTRPLDVAAVLSARRYASDVELVLDVADDLLPAGGGRFALKGGRADAACEPTDRAADLELHVSDLGALLLGGISPSELAASGRIAQRTPDAVRVAEAAFPWSPRPWGNTFF
jgi:predicted acetyltransferase